MHKTHSFLPNVSQMRVQSSQCEYYLVIWMKLTAVYIIIMSSQLSDQLSRVKPVHCHRAPAWHKYKLGPAAPRYGKLEAFPALVYNLPIVHLF